MLEKEVIIEQQDIVLGLTLGVQIEALASDPKNITLLGFGNYESMRLNI